MNEFLQRCVHGEQARHERSAALFLLVASLLDFRRQSAASHMHERMMRAHVWLGALRLEPSASLAAWLVTARAALFAPEDAEACHHHLLAYEAEMRGLRARAGSLSV